MKIAAKDANAFVLKAAKSCKALLVYGPDSGLVSERMKAVAQTIVADTKDAFNVAELQADNLKENPARLFDELNALSFTGGRRLVLLRDAPEVAAKFIEEAFEAYAGDTFLLASAGDLPPRSPLRALFEKEERFAALPCYHDEGRDLESVITATLSQRGYRVDREALLYLKGNLGNDRRVTLSELEKLMLYMGEDKTITEDDLLLLVGSNVEVSLDDVAMAVADGRMQEIDRTLAQLFREEVQSVAIIRAVLRYFMRLYHAFGLMRDRGERADSVVEQMRPPLFYKHKPLFKAHLSRWTVARIEEVLQLLLKAEKEIKLSAVSPELLCSRCLFSIARKA